MGVHDVDDELFGGGATRPTADLAHALSRPPGGVVPTAVRATAAGAAYSLSKIVTGALPFLLLPFLTHHGAVPVFLLVAAAMAVLVVDVAVLGQRSTGRSADAV